MSQAQPIAVPNPSSPCWDPDLIFAVLTHRARRQMIATMALHGPHAATDMAPGSRHMAQKHIAVLKKAGMIVVCGKHSDERRTLYGLAPAVPVQKTDTGFVIDFGFCLLRFLNTGEMQLVCGPRD